MQILKILNDSNQNHIVYGIAAYMNHKKINNFKIKKIKVKVKKIKNLKPTNHIPVDSLNRWSLDIRISNRNSNKYNSIVKEPEQQQ